jgi:hypothetical protein
MYVDYELREEDYNSISCTDCGIWKDHKLYVCSLEDAKRQIELLKERYEDDIRINGVFTEPKQIL